MVFISPQIPASDGVHRGRSQCHYLCGPRDPEPSSTVVIPARIPFSNEPTASPEAEEKPFPTGIVVGGTIAGFLVLTAAIAGGVVAWRSHHTSEAPKVEDAAIGVPEFTQRPMWPSYLHMSLKGLRKRR